jgi:hypothetical protein
MGKEMKKSGAMIKRGAQVAGMLLCLLFFCSCRFVSTLEEDASVLGIKEKPIEAEGSVHTFILRTPQKTKKKEADSHTVEAEIGVLNEDGVEVQVLRVAPVKKAFAGKFFVEDINFDGFADIVVLTDRVGNQGLPCYSYFFYDTDTGLFEPKVPLQEACFLSFDREQGLWLASQRITAASHRWVLLYWDENGQLSKERECVLVQHEPAAKTLQVFEYEYDAHGEKRCVVEERTLATDVHEHYFYGED